jgi:ribose transport system substrate-binding protein
MKKLAIIYIVLIAMFAVYAFDYQSRMSARQDESLHEGMRGEIDEKYVMVTFMSGIDYWKRGLKGFEDAAQALNVSVEYRGSTQYDVNEMITVLEQVIAKKPAGIALTAMNPTALTATIDKAVDAGIPVVLFDSGASESKAYSFLGTDNHNAGVTAAQKMAELIGGRGKVGIITLPNQLNHQERTMGFQETIYRDFPKIQVVAVKDGKGDQVESRAIASDLMNQYPDLAGIFVTEANGGVGVGYAVRAAGQEGKLKIISFDTDKGTLDMVKEGTISATMAQGTWNMGYWSLQFLFHLNHGEGEELSGGQNQGHVPVLPQYVDTGTTVVTESNVEQYYAK